ncbi:hypothetical protein EJB05_27997, partial [Eragrostis curvula]
MKRPGGDTAEPKGIGAGPRRGQASAGSEPAPGLRDLQVLVREDEEDRRGLLKAAIKIISELKLLQCIS